MDPSAAQGAVKATVRQALSQGYLSMEQLREALLLREQLLTAGREVGLLSILAGHHLRADHVAELTEFYRDVLVGEQHEQAEADVTANLDAPPEAVERTRQLGERPSEQDPEPVKQYMRESEQALATRWYLARARGDGELAGHLKQAWNGVNRSPDRSLEQLLPLSEPNIVGLGEYPALEDIGG